MKDQRTINAEVFKDTSMLCKTNTTLQKVIKNSAENQQIYLSETQLPSVRKEKIFETTVAVSDKRSFEAAKNYQNKKVCVLNFASATTPGGGVIKGSSAQEESLCRCSTLYANINTSECWDSFYGPHRALHNPLYNNDCIYTPNVTVFKSDTQAPELLPRSEWYKVDVITCAAPNLRAKPSNQYNPGSGNTPASVSKEELKALHLSRGRRILDIAKAHGAEVIILGAFGCGAFQNPPEVVAEAYQELLEEYMGAFETVEFAVYCPAYDRTNYDAFAEKIVSKHYINVC